MIFHKEPLIFDAWVDPSTDDESLLAFAVHDKVHLTIAVAHPHQPDSASRTAACVCKQFIQDRFLQFPTWMPQRPFSWSEAMSKQLLEIKQWLMAKESKPYHAISQMIWFNWLVVVHPRTAFLISIGEIHTYLFRHREWQSWWELPVDSSVTDSFSKASVGDDLPSITLRQITLRRGDFIIVADQIESLKFAFFLNRVDFTVKQNVAKQTLDLIHQHIKQHHLANPKQSVGLLQVL